MKSLKYVYLIILSVFSTFHAYVAFGQSTFEITAGYGRLLGEDEILNVKKTYEKFSGVQSSSSTNTSPSTTNTSNNSVLGSGLTTETEEAVLEIVSPRNYQSIDAQYVFNNELLLIPLGEIGIGFSDSKYFFPDGVGIFKDPITLKINDKYAYLGVGVRVDLIQSNYLLLTTELSKRLMYQISNVAIDSALLRVRNEEFYKEVSDHFSIKISSEKLPNVLINMQFSDGQKTGLAGSVGVGLAASF